MLQGQRDSERVVYLLFNGPLSSNVSVADRVPSRMEEIHEGHITRVNKPLPLAASRFEMLSETQAC